MKGIVKKVGGLAAAAVLATGVVACSAGGAGGASGPPIVGGDFHVAWNAQPPTLDPVASTAYAVRDIANNVFEGLVAMDAKYQPQPVLAQSYTVSPDHTKFDFTLRTDVTFHNGQAMTVDDVLASINRWISDSVIGKQFFTGSQVTSPGPNMVRIAAPQKLFTGLELLADPSQPLVVMPATAIAKKGPAGVTDIIGTGPYQFVDWRKDQYIQLKKFPGYKSPSGPTSGLAGEKKPMVDNLFFDVVPDASTRLSGLQTSQYKMAFNMATDNAAQLQGDPTLTQIAEPGNFTGVVFNKKAGPMADLNLRKAVLAAIDPKAILQAGYASDEFFKLNGALSQPEMAGSYTQAGLDGYAKPDPAKAKQLLQQSGYQGQALRFLTTHDYDYMYNGAVVIQQELKAIGVNVDLVVTDWATVLANRVKPEAYDMFITGWSFEPTPLAYTFLQPTWAGWTDNPAMRQAMVAVNGSANEQEAKTHYDELQQAFYDYVAIAKFGDVSALTGMKKSVGGYNHLVGPILYNVYETQQ